MYNLGMVMIGGPGGASLRPSLFAASQTDNFGLAGPTLGQDAQTYYTNGKAEVAQFDQLVARTQRIANQTVRNQIASDYGLNDPTNNNKAQYMRNAVASFIANAEKFTPIAYEEGFPTHGPARHDVGNLHNFNSDFRHDVETAETTYGILPEPQVIEKTITTQGAGGGTNWTLPLVVAGGGVAVAALLGVFSKK